MSFIASPRRLAWFLHQTFDRTLSVPLSKLITVNKLLGIQCQTQSTIENYTHIHTAYLTTALQKKKKKKSKAPFHITSGLYFSNSLCVILGLNCESSENKQTHRKKGPQVFHFIWLKTTQRCFKSLSEALLIKKDSYSIRHTNASAMNGPQTCTAILLKWQNPPSRD